MSSRSIFTADRYDRCCHLGDASIYVHCVSKWRLVCTTVFIVVPVNNLPTAPTIFNVVRYVTAGGVVLMGEAWCSSRGEVAE